MQNTHKHAHVNTQEHIRTYTHILYTYVCTLFLLSQKYVSSIANYNTTSVLSMKERCNYVIHRTVSKNTSTRTHMRVRVCVVHAHECVSVCGSDKLHQLTACMSYMSSFHFYHMYICTYTCNRDTVGT